MVLPGHRPELAEELTDLSALLRSVGGRGAFHLPHGRGDEFHHGGSPDQRGPRPRDIYCPDRPGIKVPTRDFR